MLLQLRHVFLCGVHVMLLCLALTAAAQTQHQSFPQLPPAQPDGPLHPIIRLEHQLSGKALIDELRKGGYVLYMRHAETGRITEQCGISNLTSSGEEEAKQIGSTIRALNIPVSEVWSSPACRVVDTARLLDLGNVKLTDDLAATSTNPTFDLASARQRRLDMKPGKETNIILVSHMHGSKASHEWLQLAIGEIIIFRPASSSAALPVSRMRAVDWVKLLALGKD
jgi:phosphohistidine phosphatase SixA